MVTSYGMSDHMGVICYDDDDDEVFIGKDLVMPRRTVKRFRRNRQGSQEDHR